MFIYYRNFGRKAFPAAKELWRTSLTRCRPPDLAEGRRCGRLRRVRLRGASQLMAMDGGCGGQRPLWRASTAVVLLPATASVTASVTAAAAAAPTSRCRRRRRGATARSRRHLRLQQPPPLSARRRQRGAAVAHSWLGTAGAPLAPRTANRTAPRPPGRRPIAPTTPYPAPAGTHDPAAQRHRRQRCAGRQRPGSGGLAVAAACRSPNRPTARGERAPPTPRPPPNRPLARHCTRHSPATHRTTPCTRQSPGPPHAHHRARLSTAPHHDSRRTDGTPDTAHSARAPRHTQLPATSDSPSLPAAADTVPAGTGCSRRAGRGGRPPPPSRRRPPAGRPCCNGRFGWPAERRDSPQHPSGTPTPRNAHRRTRRHPPTIPHLTLVKDPRITYCDATEAGAGVSRRSRRHGRRKSVLEKKKPSQRGKKNRCMPPLSCTTCYPMSGASRSPRSRKMSAVRSSRRLSHSAGFCVSAHASKLAAMPAAGG